LLLLFFINRWAEEKRSSGAGEGREFLEQMMAESKQAQERLEETIRSKLPQYYLQYQHGSIMSLTSCKNMSLRYDYFNLSSNGDASSSTGNANNGVGSKSILRERILEAFTNDNNNSDADTITTTGAISECSNSGKKEEEELSHETSSHSLPLEEDNEWRKTPQDDKR
jgi:hypothetical protein